MIIPTPDDRYLLFFDNAGKPEFATHKDTQQTVWVRNSEMYLPENNRLAAEFLAAGYDLSDRPDLANLEPPPSDWDGFFANTFATVTDLLERSPSPVSVAYLTAEFSKRPDCDPKRINLYWNRAIAPIPPTGEEIAILKAAIERFHLPLNLNSDGKLQ